MHNIKQNYLLIVFLMFLCFGVGLGSIYLMKTNNENYTYIKEYLTSFFDAVNTLSKKNIFKNSVYDNILMAFVIVISGFFKPGFIVILTCMIKKGFVLGFTSASMLKCFGIRGLLINMAYLPTLIISLTTLVFLCQLSIKFASDNVKNRKKLRSHYIIFAIITITIFCISSFMEAYLTTTFMEWISKSFV